MSQLDRRRASPERGPMAVAALLALAIGAQVIAWVAPLFGAQGGVHGHASRSGQDAARESVPPSHAWLAPQIVASHLFGEAPAAGSGPADAASPFTLTLLGTLAASDPEKGFAILRMDAKRTGLFAPAASIDDDTKLLRVFSDHVVVIWRGVERILALPQSGLGTPQHLLSETIIPADFVAEKMIDGTGEVPMHMADYRSILDDLDYHPQMVGSAIGGVKISGVKDEEKMAKLGIHAGDVITSMDGTPLTDPRRIDNLLKALSAGQAVTATVLRNGETSSVVLAGN